MRKPEDDHLSYLICPNCQAIELQYKPQNYQKELHDEIKKKQPMQILAAFGGYGSGKSHSSLQEVFLRALESPNGTGLLTAPTLGQLKKTTIKTLLNEVIPPLLIDTFNKADGYIQLINGFTFYMIPSDDEEKLRSLNVGIIHMEEASGIKRTIYDQLLTRMRDPNVKHKLFMVCSNPSLGWIKDVLADNEARKDPQHPEHEDYNPYIKAFVWATKLNTYLPSNFIEMNAKGKPDWWKKKFLEGSFESQEGAVYPNFPNTIIDDFDIPNDWEKFVALDHGIRNPTAVLFGAIDQKEGTVYIYRSYYRANALVPEHVAAIKPMIEEIPFGKLRFMVIDPSAKNRTDPINGKSVQSIYAEYGLFFQPGNNDIEVGIMRVTSYIERGKLKIFRSCVELIKEGISYKYPELDMDNSKQLDEKPIKVNDHAMDALRYGLMRLPEDPEMLKNVAYLPPKSYNRSSSQVDEEDDEDYVEKEKGWLSYV